MRLSSVVPLGTLSSRPPVVSKLLMILSSACPSLSRSMDGSWFHYTVFKVLVLRSLKRARLLYLAPPLLSSFFSILFFNACPARFFHISLSFFVLFSPVSRPLSSAIFFIFCWIFADLSNLPGLSDVILRPISVRQYGRTPRP